MALVRGFSVKTSLSVNKYVKIIIIMETLFVFLNVQL